MDLISALRYNLSLGVIYVSLLKITNLKASVTDAQILKGIDLNINKGEVHAIMGPNGTGKSTLSGVIMGHPKYSITEGDILFEGESILPLRTDERARKRIFLAYQQPMEIEGVTNSDFIRKSQKAVLGEDINLFRFIKEYEKGIEELKMRPDLANRYVNEGFSGGEKKRNEVLQMKMLKPKLAILDEIDSGLDVDALKIVSENVNQLKETGMSMILITHYQRLLDYIKPDFVHIMINGRIVKSGKADLITKIDQEGYDWLIEELGIDMTENRNPVSLGTCAVKK
ncbi:MAG: Fe-S cluster assembly ATPase SufC [Erysipelotrichales bacterium]|nr:Fe-S cluster assembly ATPase SufC [Erysipelotrichales bacterium]